MERKIIVTKDDSKTIFIPEMNETYHSIHGAYTEAEHVFIKNGLGFCEDLSSVKIFEMGFGTGLNTLLSYIFSIKNNKKIIYHTIEKYPVTEEEVKALNYCGELNFVEYITIYDFFHQSEWEVEHEIKNFIFKKIKNDILLFDTTEKYDLIFFDAFAPSHQLHLWEKDVLKKMYDMLNENGFLITYCAQGEFKRNLKSIGFKIENLPGPPGKREITKGTKLIY